MFTELRIAAILTVAVLKMAVGVADEPATKPPAQSHPATAATAKLLVQADKPLSLAVQIREGFYRVDLEVKEACTVTLYCPVKPGLVSLDGIQKAIQVLFDGKERTLQLSLPPGKYTVMVRSF
jgi:hypothetical protein